MNRGFHRQTDKRVGIAITLLASVLALLGSQQLARTAGTSPAGLRDIAYRAAPFGTLAGEQPQAVSGRPR